MSNFFAPVPSKPLSSKKYFGVLVVDNRSIDGKARWITLPTGSFRGCLGLATRTARENSRLSRGNGSYFVARYIPGKLQDGKKTRPLPPDPEKAEVVWVAEVPPKLKKRVANNSAYFAPPTVSNLAAFSVPAALDEFTFSWSGEAVSG